MQSGKVGITALKRSKFSDKVVVRGFNIYSHLEKLEITKDNRKQGALLNLLEETMEQSIVPIIRPYEIRTIGFEEELAMYGGIKAGGTKFICAVSNEGEIWKK